MRIIAGKYKSRRIYSMPGSSVRQKIFDNNTYRPTSDRAKESLFDTLNNILDFDSVKCLDLFSGSGSLGFEALSRGAASCDFVDISSKHLQLVRRTGEELRVDGQINLFRTDVLEFLDENAGALYDLVFADPPYNYKNYGLLLQKMFLLNAGILVIEHSEALTPLYDLNKYELISKTIGITNFKIFSSKD